MFGTLHRKLVLILVLLIISVMAVVGTFLVTSVSSFYIDNFYNQMERVFGDPVLRGTLEQTAKSGGQQGLSDILSAYQTTLGINDSRSYSILDGQGNYLTGSSPANAASLARTANIIAAMNGQNGHRSAITDRVMDIAVPLSVSADGVPAYILYISDDKTDATSLSWRFFQIVMQAVMFGLIAAILLSFLLSKTITTPIEDITKSARLIAEGDFGQHPEVQSADEIGALTQSFNDMSDRLKHTIGEVQGERDKLTTLFLHMTDGVTAFDTDGQLLHINPAAETLLGIRAEQQPDFDTLFGDIKMEQDEQSAVRSYYTCEVKRGARVLSVTLAPYGVLEREGGVIAVLRDVTEQRRLDDARREFVANVSHELRTPLTNIRSYTETLLEAEGDLPHDTKLQFLQVVSNEAERMARIVSDLLTLSKLDYDRMDLHLTQFPLDKMLQNAMQSMQLTAKNHQLSLVFAPQGSLPKITGDRERLTQVVVNILSNAVKYTAPGGSIRMAAAPLDDNQVRITVRDTGVGIPKDDIPRLFERFYRVDKARSREAGGTGLGLAIAKEIVTQHGGQIALDSVYGEGTTVSITLPLSPPRKGGCV